MREMKDSGVAWVGAIPQDWQLSKIGSLYTQRNEKVSDKDYQPLSVTIRWVCFPNQYHFDTEDGYASRLLQLAFPHHIVCR